MRPRLCAFIQIGHADQFAERDLLAGTLNGAAMGRDVVDFNHDDHSATNTGQAICAIDISAFGDVAAFKARVDTLIRDLRASERIPGVDRVWMPGEQSHAKRVAHARDGIPINPALMTELLADYAATGVPPAYLPTHDEGAT